MTECNIEEIMKQLKVLDSLRELRTNMDNEIFQQTFPEFDGLNGRLEKVIQDQEEELRKKIDECGNIDMSEIPDAADLEIPEEPEESWPDIDKTLAELDDSVEATTELEDIDLSEE